MSVKVGVALPGVVPSVVPVQDIGFPAGTRLSGLTQRPWRFELLKQCSWGLGAPPSNTQSSSIGLNVP